MFRTGLKALLVSLSAMALLVQRLKKNTGTTPLLWVIKKGRHWWISFQSRM